MSPAADPPPRRVPVAAVPVAAVAATLAVASLMIAGLRWEGRRWADADGRVRLFVAAPDSPDTSQRLFDPYSLAHLLHGVVFYWLAVGITRGVSRFGGGDRRPRGPWPWGLPVAAALEAGRELLENSPAVIARYWATTAALGYDGDSIVNSCGDLTACLVGFLLARRIGRRASAAVFVCVEIALLIAIRDGLCLSTAMLLFPTDALREWQMAR